MIDPKSLSLEWISAVANRYKKDKLLTEKVIRALLLLEGLVENDLDFIFKGGTALMLMQGEDPKRLSIDIDIIVPKGTLISEEKLLKCLQEKGFISIEENERKVQSDIQKAHFKCFYEPIYQVGKNANKDAVLLDVLFEDNPYHQVQNTPIISPFIQTKGNDIIVKTPTFEAILGDKLTAFAPYTTGIPYFRSGKSKSMEIMKQLYDIGNLFDSVTDMQVVKAVFDEIVVKELTYRQLQGLGVNAVLEDIYQTALCISLRGMDGKGDFEQLQKGIFSVTSFLITDRYTIEDATVSASKAAYLSLLLRENEQEIKHFDNSIDLSEYQIAAPNNTKLNKLKKQKRGEAFWYWYQATQKD
jgi:predicted nucleotidyltransferase component of viral defense system